MYCPILQCLLIYIRYEKLFTFQKTTVDTFATHNLLPVLQKLQDKSKINKYQQLKPELKLLQKFALT